MQLPDNLQQFVDSQVATGKYHSPDEVFVEGLRLLQDRDRRLADLRAQVQVGLDELDRGEFTDYDEHSLHEFFEEIKREGRQQLATKDAAP